jgi:ankyrin repeat protein
LEHAAKAGDLALLQRVERAGIDLGSPLRGGGSALDHALNHGHIDLANALLDRGLKGGPQSFQCVPDEAGPDLLHRLYRAGAMPNPHAVIEAVRIGRLDNAELLARWFIAQDPGNREALRQACDSSARAYEHALIGFARRVRTL